MALRLSSITPKQILLGGWLGFMLYAFPGYMSYDSIHQLSESRWGWYSDGHPPAMAQIWRTAEYFVTGPLLMLVLQSVCFLGGVYLILKTRLQPCAASITAVLVLWFPPIAALMAVIWKDSQMAAFMTLGMGLLLCESRRAHVLGLVALAVGTAMRHNALVMTLPIIALLFVWDVRYRRWRRYAIAFAAWVAVTASARLVSSSITDTERHFWTNTVAMCDITATLRYTTPTIPDDKLRELLEGTRIYPDHDLHELARRGDEEREFVPVIWETAFRFFAIPRDAAERDAMTRAWKRVVTTYPEEFLTYRWKLFQRLVGFAGTTGESPIYNWFSDIQDVYGSAARADHDAAPSKIQDLLRHAIHWFGRTPMFSVSLYMFLALLLLPFCVRDREAFVLLVSGLMGEAVLFLIAPTTDWRYSWWMIFATTLATILIFVRRRQLWMVASSTKQ